VRNAATEALVLIGTELRRLEEAALLHNPTAPPEKISSAIQAAIEKATALLDDPCWEVRRNAADALGGIGKPTPESVAALRRCLADDDPAVRIAAVTALTTVLPKKDSVPLAARLLRDPNPGVRVLAAELLGRIGPAAREAIPALKEALGDCEYRVRIAAAKAIGQMGPTASEAFSAVAALLHDEVDDVRTEALAAMVQIKGM
jgi:HEAT repeat protein